MIYKTTIMSRTSKMLEEIRQQPEALERTLQSGIKATAKLSRRLKGWKPRMILLAARGTSDNAAQFGRYLFEITLGIPTSLAAPSVFTLYDAAVDLSDVLVIGISQSGESIDINRVLECAKERGALTAGITNEAASTMAKLVDCPLLVRAGREQSVAATKTYTGQIAVLYLLAHALGGRVKLESLRRIPEWAQEALGLEQAVAGKAERLRFMERAVVVGRGLQYCNAFEFALKLMETCQVVADRFSGADFLHGPIAMVGPSFPVFLFAPAGVTAESTCALFERLRKSGAETVVFTDRGSQSSFQAAASTFVLPLSRTASKDEPADLYSTIPYILPAQLFAASLAQVKHLDPDAPRGLQKVTRTM